MVTWDSNGHKGTWMAIGSNIRQRERERERERESNKWW
jgi:hypothetical protein